MTTREDAGARFLRLPFCSDCLHGSIGLGGEPAKGIADLRRRCDAAGRDWSGIDITFTNMGGGTPGDDDFNADAYQSGLEKLAAGVTWLQVGVPGDSLAHAVETIERFGKSVIASA